MAAAGVKIGQSWKLSIRNSGLRPLAACVKIGFSSEFADNILNINCIFHIVAGLHRYRP